MLVEMPRGCRGPGAGAERKPGPKATSAHSPADVNTLSTCAPSSRSCLSPTKDSHAVTLFTWGWGGGRWGDGQLSCILDLNSVTQVGTQHFPNTSTRGQCRIKTSSAPGGLDSQRYGPGGDQVKFSLRIGVLS